MEGRTYVSLRINVLVGICVSGSTPRLTLNRVMSFSSAWIRVAVAERSSISFERVYSAIFFGGKEGAYSIHLSWFWTEDSYDVDFVVCHFVGCRIRARCAG
jgi:hypothetical protein